MCKLAQTTCQVHSVGSATKSENGDHLAGHNQLRSHSLTFFNHQPAAKAIPREIDKDEFLVIFAGLGPDAVELIKKRKHLVRRIVTDALGVPTLS